MRRAPLILALVFAATCAHAQDGHPRGRLFISPAGEPFRGPEGLQAWFARADADHDGKLTLAEFQADALRFFQTLDRNHDGQLDGLELQSYERDMVPEIAGLYGGGLVENERQRGGSRPGRGGGHRGEGGRRGGGGGEGEDGGREGGGRFGLLDIPEPVTGADLDVDGRVSLAEWTQAMAGRFALLDAAKTGALALEPLQALADAGRVTRRRHAPRGAGPEPGDRPSE